MFLKTVSCFAILYLFSEHLCENKIKMEQIVNNSKFEGIADKFSNFVFYIGNKYFYNRTAVYIILPTETVEKNMLLIMEKTVQKISSLWTVITNDSYCSGSVEDFEFSSYKTSVGINHIPDVYIIPINQNTGCAFFEAQIEKMKQDDTFNPRATFILVQLTDQCGELSRDSNHSSIFNKMWSYNLFIATLLILSECDLKVTVVTAKPFSAENICRTISKNGLKYIRQTLGTADFNVDSFNSHEHKDLQGCVFWAGTVPFPPYVVGKPVTIKNQTHFKFVSGVDIELLRLLSARMNFTYKFYKTHSYERDAWFTKLPNGTIIGILKDTLQHKIDIILGGLVPYYAAYFKYDYSTSYKFSSVSWYVTDANIAPQWKILFGAFPLEIWILLGCVFLIVSLLYYLMDWCCFISHKPNLISHFVGIPFANLFSVGLGLTSTLKPMSLNLRILFFSWAVYSLHWYIAYTSVLFTLMTNPPLEKEITTIQDLKDSGLKISLNAVYLELFDHVGIDKTTRSVLDNHIVCRQTEACVKHFLKHRNFSIMEKVEILEYLVNLQQSKIHKLSDQMISYSVSIIINKGNPLLSELNKLLHLTFQSGLLGKWERDVVLYYHNLNNVKINSEENSLPLTIQALKGAFFILIHGLIIAFIVFVGEVLIILVSRRTKCKETFTLRNKLFYSGRRL